MIDNVVIAGYKRTPFDFAVKGTLAGVRAEDLAAAAIRALVTHTQVDTSKIEDLIMGCAFPEGEQGFNIGRIVGSLAGLPLSVAGVTVNRFCGSSMQSIHQAAGAILSGAGDAFICAGVESMSRVPIGGFNPLPHPDLAQNTQSYISMGETAENLAKKYAIDRSAQDNFALRSHQKAAAAQKDGKLADEIVAVGGVDKDGCIRSETTLEALSGLKPAFAVGGSVTPGSSSPLTDGAVAVLVCREAFATQNSLEPLAHVRAVAVSGCAPEIMGIGPVDATHKALSRAGLTLDQIDLIELNEAFAAQSLSVLKELGMDETRVNMDGGAIALGHPLGASGARITGKLASLLKRENKKYGLATMCIGGGQGIATILERV